MSYDLYFSRKPETQAPTRSEMETFLLQRPNYRQDGDTIFYENEDTDVNFWFSFTENQSSEPEDDEFPGNPHQVPLHFEINYCRPHIFGLEAKEELFEFINHFNLETEDSYGMEGSFDKAVFYENWYKGNGFGYQIVLSENQPLLALPAQVLEETWRWNLERKKRQEQFGDRVFVPRIMYGKSEEKIFTLAVWPDAIPILLPEVDYVYIFRQELAPRRFLIKKQDDLLISFQSLLPQIKAFDRLLSPMPYHQLDYTAPPPTLRDFTTKAKPELKLERLVRSFEVLTQELLEEVRKNTPDIKNIFDTQS